MSRDGDDMVFPHHFVIVKEAMRIGVVPRRETEPPPPARSHFFLELDGRRFPAIGSDEYEPDEVRAKVRLACGERTPSARLLAVQRDVLCVTFLQREQSTLRFELAIADLADIKAFLCV